MKTVDRVNSQLHTDARASKASRRNSSMEVAENEGWPPKPSPRHRKVPASDSAPGLVDNQGRGKAP